MKAGRHHADNRVASPIERDRLAYDLRACAKPALPEGIAQHDDLVLAIMVIFGSQRATRRRFDAERLKEFAGNQHRTQALRLITARQVIVPVEVSRERFEYLIPILPVGEVCAPDRPVILPLFQITFPNGHQTVRILEWQRAQQYRIDDREDRGVRADAQRQGQDCYTRKAGPLQQHSQSVAHVLQ